MKIVRRRRRRENEYDVPTTNTAERFTRFDTPTIRNCPGLDIENYLTPVRVYIGTAPKKKKKKTGKETITLKKNTHTRARERDTYTFKVSDEE